MVTNRTRRVNTNTYKVTFWLLAHLLYNPELLSCIEAETSQAILSDGELDLQKLMTHSPRLEALWKEILRLTNSSAAVRMVMSPTRVGTKVLQPGHRVMSPFRQLHFDEAVFGSNSASCDPTRFFKNRSLSQHPSFKPFGGGSTYCPGRFIAKQETFIFVALALRHYKLQLAEPSQRFPILDFDKPTTGVIGPKAGHDVSLKVELR